MLIALTDQSFLFHSIYVFEHFAKLALSEPQLLSSGRLRNPSVWLSTTGGKRPSVCDSRRSYNNIFMCYW